MDLHMLNRALNNYRGIFNGTHVGKYYSKYITRACLFGMGGASEALALIICQDIAGLVPISTYSTVLQF